MTPIHDPFDPPSLTADGLAAVVAANVRFEAARHGLRQRDVAAIVRISRSAVSLRFTGKAAWTLDEVGRLAQALGIRPGELTVPPPRPTRPAW
jgi:transcriptional regulator with XRE-family HTH domain